VVEYGRNPGLGRFYLCDQVRDNSGPVVYVLVVSLQVFSDRARCVSFGSCRVRSGLVGTVLV
jgi:hypothetical protein